jgi:hypothetical protein
MIQNIAVTSCLYYTGELSLTTSSLPAARHGRRRTIHLFIRISKFLFLINCAAKLQHQQWNNSSKNIHGDWST